MTTFRDIEIGDMFIVPSDPVKRKSKKPRIGKKTGKKEYVYLNMRRRKRQMPLDTEVSPFSLASKEDVEEDIEVSYEKVEKDPVEEKEEVAVD